jgi:hypothetical protein
MILVLLALSSVMVSCASLKSMTGFGGGEQVAEAPQIVNPDASLSESDGPEVVSPMLSSSDTSYHPEQAQEAVSQPPVAEQEPAHVNQEVSNSWQGSEPGPAPEVHEPEVPRQYTLPEKKYGHKKAVVAKKSKGEMKKWAKNSKKSKKEIAREAAKSKKGKAVAKKSKVDCKKVAKQAKKAKKNEVAFCKAEKKKIGGKKGRAVASKY